jgi:hypothetical protein
LDHFSSACRNALIGGLGRSCGDLVFALVHVLQLLPSSETSGLHSLFSSWPRRRPPKQVDFCRDGQVSCDAQNDVTDAFNNGANLQLAWVAAFAAMTVFVSMTGQNKRRLVKQFNCHASIFYSCPTTQKDK